MQLMPRTAQEMGFTGLHDPNVSIHAGTKYVSHMRGRLTEDIDLGDRTWFALASYNAGLGHVKDARRLAAKQGWDQNRWFDHVEHAMLQLSKPEYANQARHGYVRGHEPVKYVREIRDRYQAYVTLTEQ